jgi:hypothetical protein
MSLFSELTKKIDQSKLLGLRVGTVGFLIIAFAFVSAFLGVKVLGNPQEIRYFAYSLSCVGIAVVFLGAAIHFCILFKLMVKRK